MSRYYALCKYFQLLFSSHYQVLYQYLDPLALQSRPGTDDEYLENNFLSSQHSKWNFKFIFPMVVIVVTMFIGDIYLVCFGSSQTNCFGTDTFQLPPLELFISSPRLMTHQAFPRAMWPQLDIAFSMAAAFGLASYLTFLRNPYTVDRYREVSAGVTKSSRESSRLAVRGKLLLTAESQRITSFHAAFHRPAFTLFIGLTLFVNGFCYVHVLLINSAFEGTLMEVLFWTVLYPASVFYLIYIMFAITLFIVLTCKFIEFRQQSLLGRLQRLARRQGASKRELEQRRGRNGRRRSSLAQVLTSIHSFWAAYEQLNGDLLRLCGHIRQSSAFWSPFLSVYFAGQIVIQCYVVYICFFIPSLPTVVKVMAIACFTLFLILLFAMISTCAQVAALNDGLERANVRFCAQLLLQMGNGLSSSQISSRLLIKVCVWIISDKFQLNLSNTFFCRLNGFRPVAVWSRTVWYCWTTTQSHQRRSTW